MKTRSLAALLAAALAVSARAQRVEIVPAAVIPSAPGASAVSASPTAALAPALMPSALSVSAPLAVSPLAAISAAPSAAPAAAIPALAAAPAAAAAAAPILPQTPALVPKAAAPATGADAPAAALSEVSAGSVKFDGAQEHAAQAVDAVPAIAESAPRPLFAKPQPKTPGDADRMSKTLIPEWMREELPVAAAQLGRPMTPEYKEHVLSRSNVWVYKWHSPFTYEVPGGLPDGHFDRKFGIRVMLKRDWRKLKDPEIHFKVLYAHEYTHWLQDEGLVTYRYGVEIPAVAVEQLRAVELVGLKGMKEGRVGFIAEGNIQNFESGRQWARGDMKDTSALYYRGLLGGIAYEVGRIAGRPEAAWEFLNLVIAEKGALSPRDAFERVTGLKK